MPGTHRNSTRRIAPEQYEHSPSTGTEEIAEIMHAPNAHAVEPVDAVACTANGCHERDPLFEVTRQGATRVLCPTHAADFCEVTV